MKQCRVPGCLAAARPRTGPAFQVCRSPSPCSAPATVGGGGGGGAGTYLRTPLAVAGAACLASECSTTCSHPRRHQSPRLPSLPNSRCTSTWAPPTATWLLGWNARAAPRGAMPSVQRPARCTACRETSQTDTQSPSGSCRLGNLLHFPSKQETGWRVHGAAARWEQGFPRGRP